MEDVATSRVGRYRWFICALLFLATTINYVDRQILALLKPVLDHELGWTNAQYGEVHSVFSGVYAASFLMFGAFIDRFGTKIGYAVSIAVWSLAALSHAFVGSIGGFFRARIALGLGEGGNFPSAVKATALWFPKKERAFATTLFNAGTNAGAIVAPALIPWMAGAWGWRSTFVAAGIAGLLWLLLWLPFYDVPEKTARLGAAERAHIRSDAPEIDPGGKVAWLSLFRHRQTWSYILAKLLTDPVWWFFLFFLPDYFNKTRHLDIQHMGPHLVVVYCIVTVLSIAGGWLTGYLIRSGWTVTRARKTCMFGFALCVLPILLAGRAGNWEAVFLIGLAMAAHQAWSANLYTTVSDMFPKKAVGTLVGIGGMAGAVGGIFMPTFAGTLLDRLGATAAYGVLFTICAFAYVVAFALNHLLAPRFEPFDLRDS